MLLYLNSLCLLSDSYKFNVNLHRPFARNNILAKSMALNTFSTGGAVPFSGRQHAMKSLKDMALKIGTVGTVLYSTSRVVSAAESGWNGGCIRHHTIWSPVQGYCDWYWCCS